MCHRVNSTITSGVKTDELRWTMFYLRKSEWIGKYGKKKPKWCVIFNYATPNLITSVSNYRFLNLSLIKSAYLALPNWIMYKEALLMYKCYVSFHLFSIFSNILGCYPETNVKESKNHTLHLPSAGLCQEHCLEHNQENNVSFFIIKVWMYLRMYLWINPYNWELFHFNILSYKADFLKYIQRFHSNLTSVYYECFGQLITFHVQWYYKRTYYRGSYLRGWVLIR